MYWDTEPFVVENNHWILNFSYFSSTDDALKICIKMCKNPFEDSKSKYHLQDHFHYPNNDDFKMGATDREQMKNVIGYPAHSIVSIVSSVGVKNLNFLEPKLLSLIC